MPKTSRETASKVETAEDFEGRYEELDDYTVGFERFDAEFDAPELFRGLPDDRCQSAHWGYVISGRQTFHYADGTEDVVEAGQAYYARPGHVPHILPGTEIVEFSPTADFAQTLEVVLGNIEATASA